MSEYEERILQQSQHHITNSMGWLATRVLSILLLVEGAYIVLILSSSLLDQGYASVVSTALWIVAVLKLILEIVLLYRVIVPWGATQYYIQNDTLIRYRGVVRRDEEFFDLNNVRTISMHQGWLGRQLDYGDINLMITSSGYSIEIKMQGIYDPKKYERILRAYLARPEMESSPAVLSPQT